MNENTKKLLNNPVVQSIIVKIIDEIIDEIILLIHEKRDKRPTTNQIAAVVKNKLENLS